MDLTPVFATDYLTWDNTEPVQYERARHGDSFPPADRTKPSQADILAPISVAKRRAVNRKELAASAGVYTPKDLVWLIPQAVLTTGLVPKPGDAVLDNNGDRWTVLELALNKFKQTWRLTCRNFVLSEALYDKIDILRANLDIDAAGAYVKNFDDALGIQNNGMRYLYRQLPCRVQLITNEIVDERGIRGFQATTQIILSKQIDVTFEDRVIFGDKIFDITGYHNPERIDELPVLDVLEKV